jgi:hypothetical protein
LRIEQNHEEGTLDREGKKDISLDGSNRLLGSLSTSAYVVKMTKDGNVWSLIYRLWLKNGEREALSHSSHITVQFPLTLYRSLSLPIQTTWQTKNANIPTCFQVLQNNDVVTWIYSHRLSPPVK